ncbi:MAG: 50S ribosomal protein L1 [Leptospiraceae bacterium]|nr:50S ribosomal protein L1 [Leptospiraceae bacterium]MCB1199692.1 50S ribosomal protein L1 [Leptospiraceae bacterium]
MAKIGKKFKAASEKVDRSKEYSLAEALKLAKETNITKFDGSLEGHFNIKYKSIQNIRGVISLPHGTGREVKVLVFAKGDKAEEAKNAGADYIGDSELIEKVQGGWIDFDFVVATPDMMKDVGKLGPVLGKKGLMPKPKSGTVTLDVAAIVKELKSGRIEYRADKTGVVHIPMGKLSFDVEKLQQNVTTAFQTVLKDRPTDAKGDYIATFFIAGTMSPGIRINTKELR